MTPLTLGLIVISQISVVAGQLLIKHAMNLTLPTVRPWPRIVGLFAGGLGFMTLSFFLWLGFLQKLDLSHVFPFEGLSPVVMLLGASIFLRERVDARSWVGVLLIGTGVGLVALS